MISTTRSRLLDESPLAFGQRPTFCHQCVGSRLANHTSASPPRAFRTYFAEYAEACHHSRLSASDRAEIYLAFKLTKMRVAFGTGHGVKKRAKAAFRVLQCSRSANPSRY